jgi:hypothetical protein
VKVDDTMNIFGTGLRKYNSALENMYRSTSCWKKRIAKGKTEPKQNKKQDANGCEESSQNSTSARVQAQHIFL